MFNIYFQPVVLNKQLRKPMRKPRYRIPHRTFRKLPAVLNALAIGGLCVVITHQSLAEDLNLEKRQTQVLVERTEVLDAEIQQRQQEMAGQSVESKEYQSGFEDGYNKAIVDLLKSKLLHDPTLSPKPKGDGLYSARKTRPPANQQPARQESLQRQVTAPSPDNSAPIQPELPTATFTAPATVNIMNRGVGTASAAAVAGAGILESSSRASTNSPSSSAVSIKSSDSVTAKPKNTSAKTINEIPTAMRPATPSQAAPGTSTVSAAENSQQHPTSTGQQASQHAPQQIVQHNTQQFAEQGTQHTAPTASPAASDAATQASSQASAETTTPTTTQVTTQATTQTATSVATQPTPQRRINDKTARQWLQESNDYVAQKSWRSAIHAATQALRLDANLADAYVVRSWAHAESGQHQQALQDIGNAIGLDSGNAVAYNNRAYVHELMNNGQKAQQDYQQACSLGYRPACDTARKLKQLAEQQRQANIDDLTKASYRQFQQKDWQGVVKTTTQLLELDPENTTALVNRAGAYTELGLYSKALNDCNTALILDPNMAIAYNNKGYVLELMGELKKAAMEYETACVLGVEQSCGDFKRLSQKVSVR